MIKMIRVSLMGCYGDILKKKQENRKGESNAEGMSVVSPNETETKSFSSILTECCRKEN